MKSRAAISVILLCLGGSALSSPAFTQSAVGGPKKQGTLGGPTKPVSIGGPVQHNSPVVTTPKPPTVLTPKAGTASVSPSPPPPPPHVQVKCAKGACVGKKT